MNQITGFLCFLCTLTASAASPAPTAGVEKAFQRLYSFDFAGSREAAGAHISTHGTDPMGHAVKAASYLFSELNRLNALAGPIGEEKVKGTSLKPDEKLREEFWKAVGESQRLALEVLATRPADREALLAMAITSGLQRDYTALIDKKLRQSMDYIKAAQEWSTKLLAADGSAYDAYLNIGFSEYLIGNFPFFLKWVVKIDGVEGDKEKGLRQLEIAARNGHYMRPFAQLLLANFYRKESRLKDSERMLRALLADHPDNQVIRRELEKLVRQPS